MGGWFNRTVVGQAGLGTYHVVLSLGGVGGGSGLAAYLAVVYLLGRD